MGNEVKLLEHWRELTPQKQQKVLEFVELLKSEPETTPTESDFVPQTPLAKKLWSIRQRAIAAGLQLLNEDEIELELAERRGGFRESKEDVHRLWCTDQRFLWHSVSQHQSESNS